IIDAARLVKEAGAVILRGGAWKPRTSPYAFQGLGRPGLKLLAKAREETGLLICTEAMDPEGVGYVAEIADIIQIGARNMQNSSLLKAAGRAKKAVLLKRGMAASIEELLLSAEYLLAEGNHDVILCERGIRGFDTATRNVFDLTAIPVVHKLSHLPIIADPSHGTGPRDRRRRGGRHHGRSASQPRAGAVGRCADPVPRPVRPADARGPRDRRGDRAAGGRAGVGGGVRTENAERGSRNAEQPSQRWYACSAFRVPCSAFLAIGITLALQSPDPWPILDRASQTYQTVTSLSADFVQIIANPMIGTPDTTRGRLYQMRPSRFSMRFTAPKGDRIVADGRFLWLYTPSTTPGQVIR